MTDLTPVTALGGTTARVERFGSITISENDDLAFASLAVPRGTEVPTPFGLTLPDAGGLTQADNYGAFWTGPSQWMITGEGRGNLDFAAEVKAACPGCAVTAQTDGWTAFEIEASDGVQSVEALMTRLVNLDQQILRPGHATRTQLHHMSVFLIRRQQGHLAIIGMRTLADTLWKVLTQTLRRLDR
ncbi:sarcosine oxidase subunit gamma [Labrenzia sp. CE80]|uniref:sarcosine oxidase subunit gamma n=1 Tax=Labrenzia sp. CE80 TaxID=1788986 RepID=UPI00129B3B04|nr:sarcosine oxidase subunit gamma [Labrenzia sp. CE80]